MLVTSTVAREGKTALVCNLAAAFGFESNRVLLIDADLRQPAVGKYLGMAPTSGLSTVLLGQCRPTDAIESWRGGLFDVLASGPIPKNPSELLGSKRLTAMLTELKSRYDVVLVDSPALLPVADGSVLAHACDAALLVVTYGRTPASQVADARAALRAVSARVLGCAFFKAPQQMRTNRTDGATVVSYTKAATAEALSTGTPEPASCAPESYDGRSRRTPVPRIGISPYGTCFEESTKPSPGAEMTMVNHMPAGHARRGGPDE